MITAVVPLFVFDNSIVDDSGYNYTLRLFDQLISQNIFIII